MTGDAVKLTNNNWVLRPAALEQDLGVGRVLLINDFAAVAHAIPVCGESHLRHLCGPDAPLPRDGVISVVGPGTGLGVAMLVRGEGGDRVIATEGGHVCFAPGNELEDRILMRLRARYGRVSLASSAAPASLKSTPRCTAMRRKRMTGRCGGAHWRARMQRP